MKLLLIEPPKSALTIGGEDAFLFEPLALEYVAAGVAAEHDVRILDMRLDGDLPSALAKYQPDIVGITSLTTHVNTVRRLCDQVKRWNPRVVTVVGGHHATVVPEDFHTPFIDLIVMGEGVFAFQEIVSRFERGETFGRIPGVAFPRDGALVKSEAAPLIDLDAFPSPVRKLTAQYRAQYYSEWMKPLASMRTSKGCPHRCSFCALWKLTQGRYLKRKPERVVEELAGIEEPYVFFADDESLVDAPRMKMIAHQIKEAGIRKRYFVYGRSDTIVRHPDLLEIWRDIGLERVFVGLEFFRDEDLNYISKGSTVSDNEKAVQILQDLGIEIYASFIVRQEFGNEDFAALRSYCRRLRLSFATFSTLTPLPGTDLHEQVCARMLTHDTDYFDFIHTLLPTRLPLKDFYEEYYRLYTEAIPLRRQLALLKRYHLSDILPTLVRSRRLLARLRTAYQDYR